MPETHKALNDIVGHAEQRAELDKSAELVRGPIHVPESVLLELAVLLRNLLQDITIVLKC